MEEELNEEGAKAEQEGSGRTMLVIGGAVGCDGCSAVCRRRGPYPEGVTTPKGHTLAFWQGGLTYGATKPEEPKWRRQAAERNSQARRLGPKVQTTLPFLVAMDHQGHQNRKGRVVAQPKERPVWTGVFPDGDLPPQR